MKDLQTATQISMRQDRRRYRAMSLASAIMRAIDPFIRDEEGRDRRDAYDALYALLCQEGVEVLTDRDRAEAGLLPRDSEGWTAEELVALERARLDIMMRPITMTIMSEGVPSGTKIPKAG